MAWRGWRLWHGVVESWSGGMQDGEMAVCQYVLGRVCLVGTLVGDAEGLLSGNTDIDVDTDTGPGPGTNTASSSVEAERRVWACMFYDVNRPSGGTCSGRAYTMHQHPNQRLELVEATSGWTPD